MIRLNSKGEKAKQSVTPDWRFVNSVAIADVQVKEVAHVPVANGHVTELLRTEWLDDNRSVDQVFQRVINPGAISAWHLHKETTDRLFCTHGSLFVALYDERHDSPTFGIVSEYRIGTLRPTLIVVPPGVWHGVKNVGDEPAVMINMVDKAYNYEEPDHWNLDYGPQSEIPYLFQ